MVSTISAKEFIRDKISESKLPVKELWIWALNHTLAPWLTKFAKLDEVNAVISSGANKYEADFNRHVVESLDLKIYEEGVENLPLVDGKLRGKDYVALSNHPLGALDGLLLMEAIGKYASPTIFVGKNLMYLKNFGSYFTPVKGFEGQDLRDSLKGMDEVAETDKLIVAFPAGMCSRIDMDGNIKDTDWKTGSARIIKKKKDIIPLYFDAKNPDWFYKRMRVLDKFLKSKIVDDLGFIYQSQLLFDNSQENFTVTYGKPISYEIFKGKTPKEKFNLMQILKEHSYRLKDDKNADFKDTLKMYS